MYAAQKHTNRIYMFVPHIFTGKHMIPDKNIGAYIYILLAGPVLGLGHTAISFFDLLSHKNVFSNVYLIETPKTQQHRSLSF